MKNPLLKVLSNSSFLFLLISEFFSQFAMNLLNFILLIVVFGLVGSNTAVSGVVLAFTIPSILFGILAGAYVDNMNKKHVLVYTNALRAAAVFPLVLVSHKLGLVYLLTFLVSLITQFFIPAEAPMIPHIVRKRLLLSANALFSMGIFGSIIVAYALSGPLLILLGTKNVFVLITVLFALSAVSALLINAKVNWNRHKDVEVNVKREIREAFSVMVKKDKVYHSLFLLTLLQTLILMIAVIGPGYASEILKIRVEEFPLFFVAPAVIGMAFGAVLIGNFLHLKSKQKLVKFGLLILSFLIMSFPTAPRIIAQDIFININNKLPAILDINSVHVMLVLSLLTGIAFSFIFIPSNTLIQEETTDRQRGKIYGSLNTLTGLVSIIPVLGVGIVADYMGVEKVFFAIGIFILSVAILRIFKYK
jgi:MFS family permease